jgi:signal peptidase I
VGQLVTGWRWLALTTAATVAAAAVAARRARLEPMLVRGGSMRPTLVPGQRIAVAPPTRPLRHGAVVVVRRPGDGLEVVKRLVGLPGERVRPDEARALQPSHARELTLGPDEYLVLGDHRDASTDGRAFGPVSRDRIVGVVRFAYWPPRLLRRQG